MVHGRWRHLLSWCTDQRMFILIPQLVSKSRGREEVAEEGGRGKEGLVATAVAAMSGKDGGWN